MNIFYYSVHHILEDDEVRLFKSLGHNVFCFGVNRKDGATQGFRPSISFNEQERFLYDDYAARGGNFNPHAELPPGFEGHFSLFIVMHEVSFIQRHWHRLRSKQVAWRTIGQLIDESEFIAAPMRAEGLKIVRYSPIENLADGYCGADALIRFYKDPLTYAEWSGHDRRPLLFSNLFESRYPEEAFVFREISKTISIALGGSGNETLPGAFGFLGYEDQVRKYRQHRSYLYMTGLDIPYTLNFIEAWMTGVPVIVYAPLHRRGRFFEITELVCDGDDAMVCLTPKALVEACQDMQAHPEEASRIGRAGTISAIRLFGKDTISKQWTSFLNQI